MSTFNKISPIPAGARLMPFLSLRRADEAIAFYRNAFDAEVTLLLKEPDGKVAHAELLVFGSPISLANEYPEGKSFGPESLNGTTVSLTVYVEDVDAQTQKALECGATLLRKAEDQFYGDRVSQIQDPFGHRWFLHTRLENLSQEEMQKRLDALYAP